MSASNILNANLEKNTGAAINGLRSDSIN